MSVISLNGTVTSLAQTLKHAKPAIQNLNAAAVTWVRSGQSKFIRLITFISMLEKPYGTLRHVVPVTASKPFVSTAMPGVASAREIIGLVLVQPVAESNFIHPDSAAVLENQSVQTTTASRRDGTLHPVSAVTRKEIACNATAPVPPNHSGHRPTSGFRCEPLLSANHRGCLRAIAIAQLESSAVELRIGKVRLFIEVSRRPWPVNDHLLSCSRAPT